MPSTFKALFDRFLETPLGYRLNSALVAEQAAGAIRQVMPDVRGKRVLDIGCGPGTYTHLFTEAEYVGVDINPGYIEAARRKHPGRRFAVGDVTQLDLGGEAPFDVAVASFLLHHLDEAQAAGLLANVHRRLTRRGVLIINEPLLPAAAEWFPVLLMRLDRGRHFRPLPELSALLNGTGFAITAKTPYRESLLGIPGSHMIALCAARVGDVEA